MQTSRTGPARLRVTRGQAALYTAQAETLDWVLVQKEVGELGWYKNTANNVAASKGMWVRVISALFSGQSPQCPLTEGVSDYL
jgi:hypothetical protein